MREDSRWDAYDTPHGVNAVHMALSVRTPHRWSEQVVYTPSVQGELLRGQGRYRDAHDQGPRYSTLLLLTITKREPVLTISIKY